MQVTSYSAEKDWQKLGKEDNFLFVRANNSDLRKEAWQNGWKRDRNFSSRTSWGLKEAHEQALAVKRSSW